MSEGVCVGNYIEFRFREETQKNYVLEYTLSRDMVVALNIATVDGNLIYIVKSSGELGCGQPLSYRVCRNRYVYL